MTSTSLERGFELFVCPTLDSEGAYVPFCLGSWTMILAFRQTRSAISKSFHSTTSQGSPRTGDVTNRNEGDRLGAPREPVAQGIDQLLQLVWRQRKLI